MVSGGPPPAPTPPPQAAVTAAAQAPAPGASGPTGARRDSVRGTQRPGSTAPIGAPSAVSGPGGLGGSTVLGLPSDQGTGKGSFWSTDPAERANVQQSGQIMLGLMGL